MERTRQEKLNHIAEHYMKAMWQKAYGVLSDAHEAEDACQEAFIKIIRIVDEIRDVEELRTKALCCIIARNTAVDMARKRGHALPTEDVYLDLEAEEPQGESPEDRVIAAEGVEEIRAAIGRLPEHYREVLILRCLPKPMLRFKGVKAALVTAVCVAINFFLGLFGFSRRKIYLRCKEAMTRYNDRETSRISYLCDTDRFWNTIALADLYPIRQLDFEDIKVNFPNQVEKMLSQMYPDYMTLPPVEKRRNHFPYELDFGIYGRKTETADSGR